MEWGVYPGEQRLDVDGVQQGVVVQVHGGLRHDEAPAPADSEEIVDTGNTVWWDAWDETARGLVLG